MADRIAYLVTATDKKIIKIRPNREETIIIEGDIIGSSTTVYLIERDSKTVLYANTGSSLSYSEGKPAKLVKI
jgi:hypothetical protein